MRTLLVSALLGASVLVTGCDFTPTLDIDTPEYQEGLVLRAMLVADSTVAVRVGKSWNPYEGRPGNYYGRYPGSPEDQVDATVTLFRNGAEVEQLTERRDECVDEGQPPVGPGDEIQTYPCGPYVGSTVIEAGVTYTVRVTAEGLPSAEATVTVPRRPVLDAAEMGRVAGDRQIRVRITDPAGGGDRYGLTLYRYFEEFPGSVCDSNGCRDTTYVVDNPDYYPTAFDTSDPVILASSREIAGSGVSFASFTDDTFDGRTKTFTIEPSRNYQGDETDGSLRVQLASLSADIYDIYQIQQFGGGDENPFAEPTNLPSNVVGGYGIVGGITLASVDFTPSESARLGGSRR